MQNEINNTFFNKPRVKRELIDFNKLSKKELRDLSDKWEKEAFESELRLDKAMRHNHSSERVEKLGLTCNKLWKRVLILENWKKRARLN